MKFIVTGSEGFIGSALVARLVRQGAQVLGIDRKQTDANRHLDEKYELKIADVMEALPQLLNEMDDIDGIYHLAAQTSVFNTNIEQIMHDNIDAFVIVAMECNKRNIKLVYASSSTANPCNTTSLYGISKRFNEDFARIYCPTATGVRFHNVYGPNPRQGTLLWHILNDVRIKLYNQGRNIRHYTYIGDIIEGLIYAYGSEKQLVNIANPEEMSVRLFAWLVGDELFRYNRDHGTDYNLDITLTRDKRDRDNIAQSVDESIFTVPLQYTSVVEGLRMVFDDRGTIEALANRGWR